MGVKFTRPAKLSGKPKEKAAPPTDTVTIKLDSGRELMISPSPFRIAEALNDAVLEECDALQDSMPDTADMKAMLSKVIMRGFSSKKIKDAIWACMPKCALDMQKITYDTFESVALRSDYYIICYHVAEVNVVPFTRNLSAQLAPIIQRVIALVPKSKSEAPN